MSRGFVRAIVDPYANALHSALLRPARTLRRAISGTRAALVESAYRQGPDALGLPEQSRLLCDPALTAELHRRVWDEEEGEPWDLFPGLGDGRRRPRRS